jgi:hypothetical protein
VVHNVRLNFLVEGQTEETFVTDVLAPHLLPLGIHANPYCLRGIKKYPTIKREVQTWLKDKRAYLTTMFDLYALPNDFPKRSATQSQRNPHIKVATLETAFFEDIGNKNFIPYIQLHEFEALLFSNIEDTDAELKTFTKVSKLDQLSAIRNKFESPEHINEGVTTAPSKRLKSLYPTYEKPLGGVLAALKIGLPKLRSECKHFDSWISKLEKLS